MGVSSCIRQWLTRRINCFHRQCIDMSFLDSLSDIPNGEGMSDHINALVVALDMMIKWVVQMID